MLLCSCSVAATQGPAGRWRRQKAIGGDVRALSDMPRADLWLTRLARRSSAPFCTPVLRRRVLVLVQACS